MTTPAKENTNTADANMGYSRPYIDIDVREASVPGALHAVGDVVGQAETAIERLNDRCT